MPRKDKHSFNSDVDSKSSHHDDFREENNGQFRKESKRFSESKKYNSMPRKDKHSFNSEAGARNSRHNDMREENNDQFRKESKRFSESKKYNSMPRKDKHSFNSGVNARNSHNDDMREEDYKSLHEKSKEFSEPKKYDSTSKREKKSFHSKNSRYEYARKEYNEEFYEEPQKYDSMSDSDAYSFDADIDENYDDELKEEKSLSEEPKKFYITKKIKAILKKGKAKPFWNYNPWVYSGAIKEIRGGLPQDGELIDVCDDEHQFIAKGHVSNKSDIRIRLITWDAHRTVDKNFLRYQIKQAVYYRDQILLMRTRTNAYRLFHGEADGIPGLNIDRYNDTVIVQFLIPALERRKEILLPIIQEETHAKYVIERYSAGYRTAEGLPEIEYQVYGKEPENKIRIKEYDLLFDVDLSRGQCTSLSTGFYFDQRETRQSLLKYARDKEILDGFCYTGAFSIYLAQKGHAKHVLGIDNSNYVLEQAISNATLNNVQNVTFQKGDMYQDIKVLQENGQKFDMIILDPPRLIRDKASLELGKKNLLELYQSASEVLNNHGLLVVSERSDCLNWEDFLILFNKSMHLINQPFKIIETFTAGSDYPIHPTCWEQTPLKTIVAVKC